jgi:NAD(P)-dependent dehydrogenase (short-subunit alcohol dehydrogenase family)
MGLVSVGSVAAAIVPRFMRSRATDIVGRRKEALDQAVQMHGQDLLNGGQLIPIKGDTSTKQSISQLVHEISSKEKYVNVLVNNAGINTSSHQVVKKGDESATALAEELWAVEQSEWEDVYRTNVIGCVTYSRDFYSLWSIFPYI